LRSDRPPTPGKLIALEGSAAALLTNGCRKLAAANKTGRAAAGVSRWDASGIFFEMGMRASGAGVPSPKTLMLLHAADLSFRLRWELGPLLDQGRHVVAAPYVESYIALGKAFGVSRRWLADLFRFAPPAAESYRIEEPASVPGNRQSLRSYLDNSVDLLNGESLVWDPARVRAQVLAYLDALERRGGCRRLPA